MPEGFTQLFEQFQTQSLEIVVLLRRPLEDARIHQQLFKILFPDFVDLFGNIEFGVEKFMTESIDEFSLFVGHIVIFEKVFT